MNEKQMIIHALTVCIQRQSQKNNRKQRMLIEAESKNETGLHNLRRNVFRNKRMIDKYEKLKDKLVNESM